MRKEIRWLIATMFAIMVFNIVYYIYQYTLYLESDAEYSFYVYSCLSVVIWSALGTIVFIQLVRDFSITTPSGKVWLLMSIGMVFWCIGEIFWMIFTLQGIEAFPSLADYFYIIAYPILFVALLKQVKISPVRITSSSTA